MDSPPKTKSEYNQQYYQRNRERLRELAKTKYIYDSEAKKAYYEAHKEQILGRNKKYYQQRKADQNKSIIENLLQSCKDEDAKKVISTFLNDDLVKTYKKTQLDLIRALVK